VGSGVKTYAEWSDFFNTKPNGRLIESTQILQLEAKIAGNELRIKMLETDRKNYIEKNKLSWWDQLRNKHIKEIDHNISQLKEQIKDYQKIIKILKKQ
jgi:uncharacterized NAD(P)/FAD-binding protein YdhS